MAKSSAISMPVLGRRRRQPRRSPRACRARGARPSWPPLGVADRPRAAGVVRRRRQRVVAALAVGHADRVDRRQVERRRSRARRSAAAASRRPRSRPRSAGTARTRRRSARARGRRRSLSGSARAAARERSGLALHRREQLRTQRRVVLGGLGTRRRPSSVASAASISCGPSPPARCGGLAQQHDSLRELAGQTRAGRTASLRASSSRQVAKASRPRLDRPLPAPGLADLERAAPADAVDVGVDGQHRASRQRRFPGPRQRTTPAGRRARRGRCRRRPRRRRPRSAWAGSCRSRSSGSGCSIRIRGGGRSLLVTSLGWAARGTL